MNTPNSVSTRMRFRRRFSFLSLLVILVAPGCSNNIPTSAPADDAIMPLAVGNRWIGLVHKYDVAGSVTDTYYDTIEIVEKLAAGDGSIWYASNEFAGDSVQVLYTNDSAGLRRTSRRLSEPLEPCECRMLPFPARTGDMLPYPTDSLLTLDANGDKILVEVVIGMYVESDDAEVDVPLGRFRTILYHEVLISPDYLSFGSPKPWMNYKPALGPVKIEWYPTVRGSKIGPVTKSWGLVETRMQ